MLSFAFLFIGLVKVALWGAVVAAVIGLVALISNYPNIFINILLVFVGFLGIGYLIGSGASYDENHMGKVSKFIKGLFT